MTFFSFDCIRNLAFKAFRGSPGIYEEISGKFHIPRVLVHLNFLIQLGPFYPRFSLHENEIDRVEMRRKGDEEGRKRCEREREREKERKRERKREREREIEKVLQVVNAPMHIYVTLFVLNGRYKSFFLFNKINLC